MKKCKNKKMEDGGVVKKPGTDVSSAVTSLITDLLSTALDQKKAGLMSDIDSRDNPSDVLKKANSLDTGKSIVSGAGKGASIGTMIAPGIGTAIGAGLGALTSGLGRLIGSKDRKEAAVEATKDWSESWSKKTGSSLQQYGYKKGGEVKGKGTGTSDSIKIDAKDGSFIVPADNSEYAMELGREYLGWNDGEKASKKDGNIDIKASNGEVMFTPKEVSVLKYHGVDVDALAPKAKPESKMKSMGGKNIITNRPESVISKYNTITPGLDQKDNNLSLLSGIKQPSEDEITAKLKSLNLLNEEDPESKFSKVMEFAPEILGAIQSAGGAYGLLSAGRQPDMQVSKSLMKLSSEVRKLSEFGYEPAVLNALNAEIENTRRNISRTYTDSGNVSGLERMAGLNSLLSTTIDKKAGLAFADAAEKSRKFADVLKIDTMKAGQEFDINRMNIDSWYNNQEVFSAMISAGVSNIIGARQLKSEQDALRQIGTNKPTFTK